MKIITCKVTSVLLIISFYCGLPWLGYSEDTQIHPANKVLLKLYPRSEKLYFPEVPRISAIAALDIYRSGKALFVHIGDAKIIVPGSIHFRESETWKLDVTKLAKIAVGRKIITYCT